MEGDHDGFIDRAPDRSRLVGPLFETIEAPECAGAQALYELWRQGCADTQDIPSREIFTFEAIKERDILGHFFVIEPIDGGRDWRYRLMGSRIVWLFGRDVTNIPFSEHFYPDEARRCIELSNHVVQSLRPLFLRARFVSGDFMGKLETMSLPVWSPRRDEVWLVGASFPFSTGEQRAMPWTKINL